METNRIIATVYLYCIMVSQNFYKYIKLVFMVTTHLQ